MFQNIFSTGALYVRPRWSSQDYQKMWIKSLDVDIDINDQVAETYVDQTFYNELDQSVEAVFIFPLPKNAMVTNMAYWVNGERYEAEIRERQEAVDEYNDRKREWLDPALMEKIDNNLYRLKIVPISANSEVRTEITYVEMCTYDFGVTTYEYFLNTTELSSQPLETVHLTLDAITQNPYNYFNSPSHNSSAATQITKHSDYHYNLVYGDEDFMPDTDLRIEWETKRDKVQYSLLTYTPTSEDSMGESSFYAIWVTPPDSLENDELLPKDIIFTADVSSSMEGDRILALKESLKYFLDLLNPDDRFNIITFGTHVVPFKNDLVEANANNISEAQIFVSQIYALGMTNISAALDSSFDQSFRTNSSKNLIFLTDGMPTLGETNIDSINNSVMQNNKNDVRLFSFGIGDNISEALLTKLALDNHGYAHMISADDSIETVVNNHFERISKSVMTDLEFDYNGFQPWDRYPKNLTDLFWGSQTMEMGLYDQGGEFNVELSGMMRENFVNYSKNMYFPDTTGGYRFVPRLWARAKINHLLDLIAIHGETDELVNQVIELSLRFQILTEYTALYADPDDDDSDIKRDKTIVPIEFKLYDNYPNPFNPITNIAYDLPPRAGKYQVVIKIYDLRGNLVKILENSEKGPGHYMVQWNGTDQSGLKVANGMYIYSIQAGKYKDSGKMLLLK